MAEPQAQDLAADVTAGPLGRAALRRVVVWVVCLNLGYFGVEFWVARHIGAVSLFADSIDFLEDAAVNGLVLLALAWSLRRRTQVAMLMAGLLLVPSLFTLVAAWQAFATLTPPDPRLLSAAGLGALAINLLCAFLLARFRQQKSSLVRAAWLSARNDALANLAIIAAGLLTWAQPSAWPDLVVGLGIFWLNLDAAQSVYRAAREERRADLLPRA